MKPLCKGLQMSSTDQNTASPAAPAAAAATIEPTPSLPFPGPPRRKYRTSTSTFVAAALAVLSAGLLAALLTVTLHVEPAAPSAPRLPPAAPNLPATLSALPLDAETEVTLLAHGSCADQMKTQGFWDVIARQQPQLFIFNGDIVYGDCHSAGCDELPTAWERLFSKREFARVAEWLPMIGILDDHDYGMNDCTASNPYKGFAKTQFLSRFAAPPDDPRYSRPGLYTAQIFGTPGRRLQLIVLDTRWFRDAFVPTDCDMCPGKQRYVPYNVTQSPPPTMLGEAQWSWLETQLRQPAEVRLIVSTVQVLVSMQSCKHVIV